ncbi:MAG: UDP-N-acetylmuramoyl-L-alanine--D-glutamate ligase [Candidatus Omnitrophica bacterium]|nr:UDP-N-acetylmuramoyl-L-alanine--D-glutamate ligase [Candidatus Omnitrophota bacterium]
MTMLLQAERATVRTDRFGHSWEGRRVTVVGLGRSGAAAAELLCRVGARVRLTDARKTPALCRARERLSSLGAEVVELGGHTRTLIEEAELLVVSPGVPESGGPIQWALERRLPILSEIELAFRWCPSPIVAVTGTNGKSTSVSLITELIRACGRPAVACGNLGIPFSSVVDQLTPQTVAVVEVSSFQLLWCDQFRPHIGVLLNIGTNHLDRHQDRQAYCAAKARLFQHQHPEDWAVLNGDDPHVVAIGERVRARRVWFRQNRSNAPAFWVAAETMRSLTESAQAVLQVGRVLGIADPMTWQIIRAFRGLEHRLEFIGTVGGVHFVNDSKSTTPESLLFALNQIRGDVAVILGGRDKGLDFRPLVPRLHETRVKGVVLIGESRTRIRPLLNGSSTVRERDTLDDAVQTAAGLAPPGSTVLFSPACASFDMFRDFEARGRAFKDVVARLLQAEAAAPGPTIRSAGRFGHTSG